MSAGALEGYLCISVHDDGVSKDPLEAKLSAEKISGKKSMRALFRARRDGEIRFFTLHLSVSFFSLFFFLPSPIVLYIPLPLSSSSMR